MFKWAVAVAASLAATTVEHGLPSLERHREALPEPRCIRWELPLLELGEVKIIPLVCCFRTPEDARRTCIIQQPKI